MEKDNTPPLRSGGYVWGPERVALGVTIRKLAELSGVDKAILSMAENGRMIPTSAEYQAVTDALRKIRQPEAAR